MKIQMTAGFEGPEFSLQPGDIYDAEDDEAGRLLEAGFAIPVAAKPLERAVKRRPAETRAAPEVEGPIEAPVEPEAAAMPAAEPAPEGKANA